MTAIFQDKKFLRVSPIITGSGYSDFLWARIYSLAPPYIILAVLSVYLIQLL